MISHVIIFAGGMQVPQTHLLRNQLSLLNQPAQPQHGLGHLPCKGLLLVLSSWGGNTFEARSLYGLMRSLSYPIEIHATGAIKSAAIPLMLAADRRTVDPGTTFLFHPWTWGTDTSPGHTIEVLKQFPLALDDEVAWAKAVFNQRSKLTQAKTMELELFDKPRIEDAEFALKYGLAHEIVERKIPSGVMTWNIA